jgi:hypothetical protein
MDFGIFVRDASAQKVLLGFETAFGIGNFPLQMSIFLRLFCYAPLVFAFL